jgi:hypothetical protein
LLTSLRPDERTAWLEHVDEFIRPRSEFMARLA